MVTRFIDAAGVPEPSNQNSKSWSFWGNDTGYGIIAPVTYSKLIARVYFHENVKIKPQEAGEPPLRPHFPSSVSP